MPNTIINRKIIHPEGGSVTGVPRRIINDQYGTNPLEGTRSLIDTGWSVNSGIVQHLTGGSNFTYYWLMYADDIGISPYFSTKYAFLDGQKSGGWAFRCDGHDSVGNMGAHYDARIFDDNSLVIGYFSAGSTFVENVASTTITTPNNNDYLGFRVSGKGQDVTFDFWDFGATENTDPTTWGTPSNSIAWGTGVTPAATSIKDSGPYGGLRCYTFNKPNDTITLDDLKVWKL